MDTLALANIIPVIFFFVPLEQVTRSFRFSKFCWEKEVFQRSVVQWKKKAVYSLDHHENKI